MVALLLYAYRIGVYSSRRIARGYEERLEFQLGTFCHWALGSSGLWSLARGVLLFVIGAMAVT